MVFFENPTAYKIKTVRTKKIERREAIDPKKNSTPSDYLMFHHTHIRFRRHESHIHISYISCTYAPRSTLYFGFFFFLGYYIQKRINNQIEVRTMQLGVAVAVFHLLCQTKRSCYSFYLSFFISHILVPLYLTHIDWKRKSQLISSLF